jgi:hypothetical protein
MVDSESFRLWKGELLFGGGVIENVCGDIEFSHMFIMLIIANKITAFV